MLVAMVERDPIAVVLERLANGEIEAVINDIKDPVERWQARYTWSGARIGDRFRASR